MFDAVIFTVFAATVATPEDVDPPWITGIPVAVRLRNAGLMLPENLPAFTETASALILTVPLASNLAGLLVPSISNVPGVVIRRLIPSTREPELVIG